jgi:hypothetical protein
VDPAFDFILCTRVHTFNSGISPSWSAVPPYIFEGGSKKSSREPDDIANLAFIGGKTNRAISDKPSVGYFPALIEKAGPPVFGAQCIPTDM